MELKDFIRETLTQVVSGLEESKSYFKEQGIKVLVSPLDREGIVPGDGGTGYRKVQKIEFEVAVTVEKKENNKSGIGVVAGIFSAGTAISETDANKYISTIRFGIPISYPVDLGK